MLLFRHFSCSECCLILFSLAITLTHSLARSPCLINFVMPFIRILAFGAYGRRGRFRERSLFVSASNIVLQNSSTNIKYIHIPTYICVHCLRLSRNHNKENRKRSQLQKQIRNVSRFQEITNACADTHVYQFITYKRTCLCVRACVREGVCVCERCKIKFTNGKINE